MSAEVRFGAANCDPFEKVKGLIMDAISQQLEAEANAETTEKASCDEQLAKTQAKKEELDDDIAKLTVKIDQAISKSANLEEEVHELQNELAALSKLQAEMDRIMSETHADYMTAKEDLTLGWEGVRKALSVLREYYGGAVLLQSSPQFAALMQQPAMPAIHGKATGAGEGIINMLEVCESDFAENLAKEETEESSAKTEYDNTT